MEKENHIVRLVLDKAELPEEPDGALRFGPAGSYGIHTLQVEVGEGWQGRTITAVFQNRCGSACVEALLSDGVITVPAEATAYPTDPQGVITFVGVDDKSRRVTCKLPYYVEATGCVCGDAPPPDPDKWQQYIEQVDDKLDEYFAGGNPDDVWTQTADGPGWAAPQGGGGGTGNYNNLSNKPRINGNELTGNKTWQQLGFPDVEAFATAAAQSAQEAQTAAGSASSAASAASGSATAAQGSASTASTKASEADTSAQDAAQSASAAEQSKTAAAQSASDASQSAQQAADSAGAADESATAASGSASAAASGAARAEAAADKIPMPAGSADAGKFLAANAAGDGYELKTGGGGGTTDYNALSNKPSIGGVTIEDDKTAADYGLAAKEELPKQATDTEAGIAKFQPIAEQGDKVPASILPNGTVVVPPGGGSGGGINPTLLATLNGDGSSVELTADVDLTDGLYAFGGGIPENTPDDNKGQTLYAKIGDTGIFGQGIRLPGMPSNAAVGNQNEVVTIYVKNNAMYVCGAFSAASNRSQLMFYKPDGVPIVKQKIALYSQTSKPVPVGVYAMLWRLG